MKVNEKNIGLLKTYRVMKSKAVVVGFFVGILLTGCSTTTHMFEFYGETHESDGRDFYYVDYSVTGSATAVYTWVGGGDIRDGLIADAKRNLMRSHPLGPNQSYVNMSIDISKTAYTAFFVFNGRIELTATVSADVIQFGQPPLDYEIPIAGASKVLNSEEANPQFLEKVESQLQEPAEQKKVELASEVLCRFKGVWFSGVVVKENLDGTQFHVQFDRNGKTTTKWFGASAVRLKDETTVLD